MPRCSTCIYKPHFNMFLLQASGSAVVTLTIKCPKFKSPVHVLHWKVNNADLYIFCLQCFCFFLYSFKEQWSFVLISVFVLNLSLLSDVTQNKASKYFFKTNTISKTRHLYDKLYVTVCCLLHCNYHSTRGQCCLIYCSTQELELGTKLLCFTNYKFS